MDSISSEENEWKKIPTPWRKIEEQTIQEIPEYSWDSYCCWPYHIFKEL